MDIRTLVICLIGCNLFLTVFLFAAARAQKTYPGFRHWALSCLAFAFAYTFVALSGLLPGWISVLGVNAFLPLAALLRLKGLRRFYGEEQKKAYYWASAGITALMMVLYFAGAGELARALAVAAYLDLFIFLTAREVWLNCPVENFELYLLIIAVSALNAALLTLRDLSWLIHPGFASMLHSNHYNEALFLYQIAESVAWACFIFALNVQRQNQEIAGKNGELEAAHRVKDRFLAVLGHDLRGPLGGLEAALETYLEERGRLPEAERVKLLTMFLERSRGINAQLESLLAWGRHQAGRGAFAPEQVRAFDIFERELLALNNAKGVVFSNDIDPDAEVYADPGLLAQVARNLLSNALKFSPKGGEVRLSLEAGPGSARLTVADRGAGVPEKDLKNIFRLGAVPARWGTDGEAGTGLGLPLCAQIAARHGGALKAANRPEGGAAFTLTLPAGR